MPDAMPDADDLAATLLYASPGGGGPADYVIEADPDGSRHASDGGFLGMSVLPDGPDAVARLFKRRAIKNGGSPAAYEVTWLVGELDGVRCYVLAGDAGGAAGGGTVSIVLTRRDLYP